ncbi:MAG: ABC transporter ATP-binding protein, partial [Myxococcota bacterium]
MGPMGGGQNAGQETGLPFAGIPPEYADAIDALVEDEEEIPIPDLPFSHVEADPKPFTLRSFLLPHWLSFAWAAFLIGLDALALNIGPWLLQLGIDKGVWKKDFGVLQLIVLAYFAAIVTNLVVARWRILITGNLGQRLMNDLRIKLFTHLQRLSLD